MSSSSTAAALTAGRPAAAQPVAGISCVLVRSRSPCDAARLSALLRDRPTEHGCRPRPLDDNRWPSDDVLDRVASCSDRQMQRLTLAAISGIAGLWREHQTQRIDDVRARLLPRTPLAKDTSHLRDRRNDPAFVSRLINNRQIKPLSHRPNDTDQRQYRAGRRGRDSNPRTESTPVTRFPVAPIQPLWHLSLDLLCASGP